MAKIGSQMNEVDLLEKIVDGLGSHLGDEFVGIVVRKLLVPLGKFLNYIEILLLGEKVKLGQTTRSRIDHDVALVIDHCVELLRGKT